jgi:tetratricopeptide (TPR) repeat protein
MSIVGRPRASLVHPSPECARAAAESLSVFEATGDTARAALSKVLLAVEGVAGAPGADQSARLLEEAEADFAREAGIGGDWGRAYVAYVRMEIALKHGGPEDAAELGNAAASAFRTIDDRWGLSGVLQHLGRGMREYGRYDESEAMLREALVVSRAAGKDATVPWILAEIGILLALRGDRTRAESAFHDSMTASRRVGDGAGGVLASHGTGLLHQLALDWDAARSSYTDAVDGFRLLATPEMESFSLCNRADCHEALGDDERAGSDFRAALELGRTWSEPAVVASALEGLARLSLRVGDVESADLHAAEAARVRARSGRVIHSVSNRCTDGTTGSS